MDTKSLVISLRQLGLSQNDIAIGSGVSQGTISNLEIGRYQTASMRTHLALMQFRKRVLRKRRSEETANA